MQCSGFLVGFILFLLFLLVSLLRLLGVGLLVLLSLGLLLFRRVQSFFGGGRPLVDAVWGIVHDRQLVLFDHQHGKEAVRRGEACWMVRNRIRELLPEQVSQVVEEVKEHESTFQTPHVGDHVRVREVLVDDVSGHVQVLKHVLLVVSPQRVF